VLHKAVYTFINACSSVVSSPIELKPFPVHFAAHFSYFSELESSAVHKMGSCDGFTFETSLLDLPTKKSKNYCKK
jgi:hypothetical protein